MYKREEYQQLRKYRLLVTGCRVTVMKRRWCDVTVLNAHAPTEDKMMTQKKKFYEE